MKFKSWGVLALVFTWGCDPTDVEQCTVNGDCEAGFACQDGRCVADGMDPDEGTTDPDGATEADQGADGATLDPDGAVPDPDDGVQNPDGAMPDPDGAMPDPDDGVQDPDDGVQDPDGAMPDPDGAAPDPDGAVPDPDDGVLDPDGAVPDPDGAVPDPDGAVLDPDEGVVDPCADAECTLEVAFLGTDIVVVGQVIPIAVEIVGGGARQAVPAGEVEWAVGCGGNRGGCVEVVELEGGGAGVTGVRLGGGDQHRPDGTVWISATHGDLETGEHALQVVRLREGVGIYPIGAAVGSEEPEAGAPAPPGADRYDGLYVLANEEQKWYCVEDADCPEGGTCDAWRHACLNDNGSILL